MSRPRGRTPSERRWAMDGPSARAVGQRGEPREPDAGGRTSGGVKTFGDFGSFQSHSPSRAAAAKPVEDGVLVSRMAKPCHLGVGQHSSGNEVTQPLTLALSRRGRGDGYRGAMRCAYCTLRLSPKGRGDCYRGRLRFANRPYSTLLVPGQSETPSRVEPSHLAEARDAGLASANDATAPGSRYHNAPLTRRDKTGANGHPPHPTEPTGPDPRILLTQVSESTGFLRWFKVTAARLGWGGASGVARQSVNGPIFPRPTPFSHLSGVSRVG